MALLWRHMGVMASEITGNSTVSSTDGYSNSKENTKDPHYWPFVRGIHRWQGDSPHKVSVLRKAFPYNGFVIMYGRSRLSNSFSWAKSSLNFICNIVRFVRPLLVRRSTWCPVNFRGQRTGYKSGVSCIRNVCDLWSLLGLVIKNVKRVFCRHENLLTHWDQNKMAAILQSVQLHFVDSKMF